MGNEEVLSKKETIRLIEEGDRYAGIKFEELKDDFKTIMETYDLLDMKIDRLEIRIGDKLDKLETRMDDKIDGLEIAMNTKIDRLFEDNQRFFEELRAMRRDFSEK
jgi:FtsZ-binding cell division protein ZapB